MSRAVFATLVLAACGIPVAEAQERAASQAEIELIREAFRLDEIPPSRHPAVRDVQATYTPASGSTAAYLVGRVYLEPYAVGADLCVMEVWAKTGRQASRGYEWGGDQVSHRNWLRRAEAACESPDEAEPRQDAVVTSEPVPSAELAFIMRNADELLAQFFERAAADAAIDAAAKARLLSYRAAPSPRLDRVGITDVSLPGIGFAFRATFRSAGSLEGPAVVFSVSPAGFVVHSVGIWIA